MLSADDTDMIQLMRLARSRRSSVAPISYTDTLHLQGIYNGALQRQAAVQGRPKNDREEDEEDASEGEYDDDEECTGKCVLINLVYIGI